MKTLSTAAAALAGLALAASAQTRPAATHPPTLFHGDVKTPAPLPVAEVPEPARQLVDTTPASPLASAPTPASRTELPQEMRLPLDFSEVRFGESIDGELWARGESWKMRFGSDSATFVPFFSSRSPRNFDITFDLLGVTAGSRTLALGSSADVRRSGDAVTLDHGLVDEVYELGLREVEQKFVIESLPAQGDVVVRLAARTELAGASSEAGFTFANDWGRVEYGRATAVDADGRTLALESTLENGGISIRVPAAFAAEAALPLTIDPLITVYGVETLVSLAFSPDSAYNNTGSTVLHCYAVVFSLNDFDVAAWATDRNGNAIANTFWWTDFTSLHWTEPRTAYNGATDRFLICGSVGQPGSRSIQGHVRTANPATFNSAITLYSNPSDAGEKFNVDCGGDPYPVLPANFFIVYERVLNASDHDIHGRIVQVDGSAGTLGTYYLDNSTGTLDAQPTISKSNRADTWNIVWQRDVFGQARHIFGTRIQWAGGTVAATYQISTGGQADSRPSASSSLTGTHRYLVAFDRDFTSDRDIILHLYDGTTLLQTMNLSAAWSPTFFNDQGDVSIDSDGSKFLVAYNELESVGLQYDIYAAELQWNANGMSVRENRIPVAITPTSEQEVQVVAAESGNDNQTSTDYTVIFNRGAGPGTGPVNDVFAALVTGSAGGSTLTFCTRSSVTCPCNFGPGIGGCANSGNASGAHMAVAGNARTTQDTLSFQISGLRPNATCLVFQGTATINSGFGSSLDDGVRCVGGFTRRFSAQLASGAGTTSYPPLFGASISAVGLVPYEGGTFYYQTWYRDTANFCSAGATNLSDAVMVDWTP
ncbi:MAG: hypothetical protein NTV21_14770 [Planctomycetota bacterium]|nr:hypothetical protein [Planctomycetota bacterium]